MNPMRMRSGDGVAGVVVRALVAVGIPLIIASEVDLRRFEGVAILIGVAVGALIFSYLSVANEAFEVSIDRDEIVVRYVRRREAMRLREAQSLVRPKHRWIFGNGVALVCRTGERLELPLLSESQIEMIEARLLETNPSLRLVHSDQDWLT